MQILKRFPKTKTKNCVLQIKDTAGIKTNKQTSPMDYHSAIKKNEIMPFATTWMDLEIIILSDVRQTKINII